MILRERCKFVEKMQVVDAADKILSEFLFLLESGTDTKVRLLVVSAL